ncbi:MAG: hypothetical protein LBM70_08165 [Victivallales bacterium]|jgi:hypothetical protein|nr:hypothetical protein [Victivallales bacterium]
MGFDYEGFRFTTNYNIGAGNNTYSGFASRVDGELGSAFTIATAYGAMIGLNNITVAAGGIAVISISKSTKQNNGKLQLSATATRPTEKQAANLKADVGFANIVTAVDGTQYHVLESSAYVVVNSSRFEYTLSATQSTKTLALFNEVEKLLGSNNWRKIWEQLSNATQGKNVDVVNYIYSNYPETRSVIDGCRNILGEVPVVTYELNVKNGKDTVAPVIDSKGITIINMGNKVKAECTGSSDNYFVLGFEYRIVDESGKIVETGVSQNGTETIRPKLTLGNGNYSMGIRAYDYSKNYSAWVDRAITVNNNLYIDATELAGSTAPLALSKKQTAEKGDILEYNLTPQYSGSYNLILQDLDANAKITITEYATLGGKGKKLRSKSMTADNFANGAGSVLLDMNKFYTISVSAKKDNADYTVAITGEAYTRANLVPEDNWSDLKTVHGVSSEMKVMIQSDSQKIITNEWVGFTDSLDVRELEIVTAGMFQLDMNTNNQTRMSIYSENAKTGKLKKLKSISAKSGGGSVSIGKLLLDVGHYYLALEAPKASKGINADYSVQLNSGGTELFTKANMNPLDNTFSSAPLLDCSKTGNLITGEWVGFGDQFDYYRVPGGTGGAYEFIIDGAVSKLKLTVYKVVKANGTQKLKKVKSVTTKAADAWSADTGILQFAQGEEYVVAVENPNAKKGAGDDYDLELQKSLAFNWGNNSKDTATVLTGSVFEGVLSKASGGDFVDFIDLSGHNQDLSIDMVSGKAKVSLFNSDDELIKAINLNPNKGLELNPVLTGCAYMRIDAASKKLNEYTIAIA